MAARRRILRDSAGIGIATGAYGLSFGALAAAAGLSLGQTCTLSLAMFTGASQFALVGVLDGGGAAASAAATAVLLGTRNAFYGLRLATLLDVRGARRLAAAQLVIDESTAMAVGATDRAASRLGFWATGVAVFVLWNLATVIGAVGADALTNPSVLGLDAAAAAAFLALLAPQLQGRTVWATAAAAAVAALALTPILPPGLPVLAAAGVAAVAGWRPPPGLPAGRRGTR
ncbi:MAG: AzlC family ABC transporter permease [Acidimicrobiales bacterium]|nr:AzlC family ABC transporter permease [Acidimicrobiales bacterium]